MAIVRNNLKDNFSNIPNSVIQCDDLSDGDFRLLIYLYSLPDDWKIFQENLGKKFNCNRENINKKIRRLKKAGYLEVSKNNNNEYVYKLLNKNVSVNNTSINDTLIIDTSINDTHTNNLYIQKNNITNTYNNKEKNIIKENFEIFWKEYPKKQAKAKTKQWFEKNKPDEELMNKILESLSLFKKTSQWTKDNGQFIPLPTTWLNGKRWEDEIQEEVEMTDEELIAQVEKELKEEGFYDNE